MARTSIAVFLSLVTLAGCGGRLDLPSEASDGGVSETGTDTGVLCDDPSACGPAIRMPAVTCWDGSIGGNTGRCLKQADGTCGWEIRDCPPESGCTGKPGECGSERYCARPTGVCGGTGTCKAKPTGCDFGWSPVCGCDGKTYGNACAAATAGVTVASLGECVTTGKTCNPSHGMHCAADELCKFPDGMCWASDMPGGTPGAPPSPTPPIPTGTCTKIPPGCPDKWDPVCGCDGKTYPNDCDALMAGVGVQHPGECSKPGKACGGFPGITCAWNEYCDWADADICGGADAMGVCKPRPTTCDGSYDPVCGCNGTTYPNPCMAYGAGTDVYYKGTCH